MNKTLLAGLLALDAHITHHGAPVAELPSLPFFRQFVPEASKALGIAGHLLDMQDAAAALGLVAAPAPSLSHVVGLASMSVLSGLRAMLVATGCPVANEATLLREANRLVVKNAFPKALSCYAAGGFDNFSVHRLPFFSWPSSVLFNDNPKLAIHNRLGDALNFTRNQKALATKKEVQANPSTAICNQRTGKPLTAFKPQHWMQLTWRLGYTTVFDLLALAASEATDTPAPVELLPALLRIVAHYNQVFSAYLASDSLPALAGGSYVVVGEAYAVALPESSDALAA